MLENLGLRDHHTGVASAPTHVCEGVGLFHKTGKNGHARRQGAPVSLRKKRVLSRGWKDVGPFHHRNCLSPGRLLGPTCLNPEERWPSPKGGWKDQTLFPTLFSTTKAGLSLRLFCIQCREGSARSPGTGPRKSPAPYRPCGRAGADAQL